MSDHAPSPEVTARKVLRDLLKAALEPDHADVHYGPPLGDAATRNVWVGGVDDTEDHHGMRGEQGPSVVQRFVVHVHCEVEDGGAGSEEVDEEVWQLVGLVRQTVRNQTRGSTFGDGIQGSPKVVRTVTDGPVPLEGRGHVEQVLVDVQFLARI